MRDWQLVLGLPLWVWLFVFPTLLAAACLLQGPRMARVLTPLWRVMDRIYLAAGVVASCFMVTILLLIVGQMVARWSALTFPGSTEYSGYAMAATSFFALAYALTQGAHIRVSIFLTGGNGHRFWLDAVAMLISACVATYFARYAIKSNFLSEMINDRTQGQDFVPEWLLTVVSMFGTWPWNWGTLWANSGSDWVYTPIWLPQLPMSIGTVLLAIAVWDHLTRLLATGSVHIQQEGVE
ncbi:TRAP transporter small permease subunit [Epibacterium sp. SM1979]|uniref:TRAP transporter small permease protein n=1 Tax=Tritonibacter litoralis TaxID=2662264 RepID=A0A843Y9A4_9RHOB|nr:TRAP transporter small permease subunit [Tritonibacter litoralis]MQQ07830.1 TRAP transporter small permease subunit [Tritonibacter litoralis]